MMLNPMFKSLVVCAFLAVFGAGCASDKPGSAEAPASGGKKGHWVTLPPVTGSHLSRRVWVEDGQQAPDGSVPGSYSREALEDWQRKNSANRPGAGGGGR